MPSLIKIQLRGVVVGEATLEELQNQLATGQLSVLHKLSTDGTTWQYVADFPGLSTSEPSASMAVSRDSAIQARPKAEEWFVSANGEQNGPYSSAELSQKISTGEVSLHEKVWQPGFEDWRPINTVFRREAEMVVARQQAEVRRRQKIAEREAIRRRHEAIPLEERSYSLLGVASLVFSLLWIFGLGSLLAIILGIIAIYDIQSSDGYRHGMKIAIAGCILGVVGALIGAILIPLVF